MIKMSKTKKIIALVLCLGIMLSFALFLAMEGPLAQAKTSLPGVEEIKLSAQDFNILEIVPAAGQGSVGYYISGQEPVANWKQTAARMGREERLKYLKELFSGLSAAGLIGEGEYSPLKGKLVSGSAESDDVLWFEENYPWNTPESTDGSLSLLSQETQMVKGFAQDLGAGRGEYSAEGYELLEKKEGQYSQRVTGFATPNVNDPGDSYYYDVKFESIDDGAKVPDGSLVYVETEDGDDADLFYDKISLRCLGIKGDPNFPVMVLGKQHYTANFDRPLNKSDVSPNCYRAIYDGYYRLPDGLFGWFAAANQANKLTYVGRGNGSISFTPDENGEEYTIAYSTVYYKGGFSNNNWFLKHVFDWEETEPVPNITVTTITPDQVPGDLSEVDMIVLTGGFALNGEASKYTSDIAAEAKTAIETFANNKKPVLVDSTLPAALNDNTVKNISTLVQNLAGQTGGNDVINGSVYFYSGPLATSDFATPFEPEKYLSSTSPFFDVYTEIDYENFLRKQANPNITGSELLSETVSMASAIRYVLNCATSRSALAKTKLNVLEIQPRSGKTLSAETVGKWSGLEENAISITTMSTSEFIGKIEDLSEAYDLIYIGDSTEGFDTDNGVTIYNDRTMNGLIYTNIGDTVVAGAETETVRDWDWDNVVPLYRSQYNMGGWDLSGLLDRDYANTSQISANDTSRTFRLSGNDLTETKMEELKAFAQAGYPIVVGGELVSMRAEKKGGSTIGYAYAGNFAGIGANSSFATVVTLDPACTEMEVRLSRTKGSATVANGEVSLYVNNAVVETKSFTGGDPVSFDISVYKEGDKMQFSAKATGLRWLGSVWTNINNSQTHARSDSYTLDKGISNGLIDDSSYMYELLGNVSQGQYKNVVAEENLNENSYAQFRRYLNLSKPEIKFADNGKPAEYDESKKASLTANSDGVYSLAYTFTINNATDPDPVATGYFCRLYVDVNGDGRYTSDELLDGVRVYEGSVSGASVAQGSLRAGVQYYAVRQLPAGMKGVVPWKLEIVKSGAEHVHTSETGFAYIKPDEPVKLNILQINTSRGSGGLDLSQAFAGKNGNFAKLVDEVKPAADSEPIYYVIGDYAISIETIRANALENKPLDKYDMLILGFDDMWQELSTNAAEAVARYIETGKAVLFAHDTSSFSFLPSANFELSTRKHRRQDLVYNTDYWGYNFNTILRDAVGLDRYGVTSDAFGGIRQSSPVTNNYAGASAAKKQEILDAGYSIAWAPKSGREETVSETQGLNDWLLMRYRLSGGKFIGGGADVKAGLQTTTKISQVNKGQITTYPFNVNMDGFGGSWKGDVASTHSQYFQLNMNSDDIVVWYCLDSDEDTQYGLLKNDVINSYYIYSRGNVTYTGMGHTPGGVTENEAKLFVNTMVAAYRVAQPAAGVAFTDSEGRKETAAGVIIPAEGESLISGSNEESRRVYFVVTDDSIGTKNISVRFGLAEESIDKPLDVYNKLNQKMADSLVSGEVYYVLVDDIMKMEGFSATNAQTLYIKATIRQEGQPEKTGTDSIPIYKFSLFNLS